MTVDEWLQSMFHAVRIAIFQKQITSMAMIANLDDQCLDFLGVTNIVHRKLMLMNKPAEKQSGLSL